MRQLYISLIFSFFSLFLFGQSNNIKISPSQIIDKDVIQNQLLEFKSKTDSILLIEDKNANAYRISAFIDIIQFQFPMVKKKIKKAIYLDSITNNEIGLAEDYDILARYYKDLGKNDSAYIFCKKALSLPKNKNPKQAGRHLKNLMAIYSNRGQKDSAMIVIKDAIEFSLQAHDSLNLLILKAEEKNLLTRGTHDLKTAFDIYYYGEKINNNFVKALAYGNIGKYYQKKKDSIGFSVKYLDSAIVFFKKSKNFYFLNITYPSRAYVASRDSLSKKKPIDYYKLQYDMVKNTEHIYKEMTMINLATKYYKIGRVDESIAIYKSIIELSKKKEIQKILIAISHQNLSSIYEYQKNYKEALIEYKELYKNEMEAYSTKVTDQANKYKIEFETEKKEKENLQLKNDNIEQELLTQKATTRNWILLLGLLILSISAFFIWKRYKSEAKAKKTISQQKNEIEKQKNLVETLQKELHHRMKNNLSFIDLFINLAKGRFSNNKYQTKLNELQNRMRSMFEIHKQLFKKEDITSVLAKKYIDTLVENVCEAYNKNNIIITNDTHENETLLSSTSFPVGLIINEFVTNTFKYAFNDNENGTININLTSDSSNYHLTLHDNGKGLPQDFDIKDLDSFGMEIIQLLTKEYGGKLTLNGAGGVSMDIYLPKIAA
ncbi:histidine kinase dimerization/phosphoacceptor domain -containing protein [uncultured Kordia sp.]|uniref:histidine kinase dimerization/phosphoacceptor domain -containing protein n=1 Tax=uncultured Kordia sp. TaxID=507699 RepID=UPI00260D0E15|nr:histidine kinase dimerization/phosphoacceptor domain -containing protein [uncultured Kordia sp.]